MRGYLGKGLIGGIVVGVAMAMATLLFYSGLGAGADVGIRNTLVSVNTFAFPLGIVASGNVHQPSEVAVGVGIVLQWALIGLLIGLVVGAIAHLGGRRRNDA